MGCEGAHLTRTTSRCLLAHAEFLRFFFFIIIRRVGCFLAFVSRPCTADLEHSVSRRNADAGGGAARRCRGGRRGVSVGVRGSGGWAVLRSPAPHVSPWGKFLFILCMYEVCVFQFFSSIMLHTCAFDRLRAGRRRHAFSLEKMEPLYFF